MKKLTIDEKIELAKQGKNLDILVKDLSSTVRLFVLDNKRDEDLDILVHEMKTLL